MKNVYCFFFFYFNLDTKLNNLLLFSLLFFFSNQGHFLISLSNLIWNFGNRSEVFLLFLLYFFLFSLSFFFLLLLLQSRFQKSKEIDFSSFCAWFANFSRKKETKERNQSNFFVKKNTPLNLLSLSFSHFIIDFHFFFFKR